MGGKPSPDVQCRICTMSPAWPKSRMCRACITSIARKGYTWTPEQDDIIRRAYAVGTARELTSSIDDAVRRLERSRSTICHRAERLGCLWVTKHPWKQAEIDLLCEHLGEWSLNRFVKALRRSHFSVLGMIARLKLSRRLTAGYDQKELADALGTSDRMIRRWIRQDLLRLRHGRITETELRAFLYAHPELYSLKRVDELWFKALIFPSAACFLHSVQAGRPRPKKPMCVEAAA